MKYDVICVGSALLDVYLKSDKFVKIPMGKFEGGVAICEEFGGKTEVDETEVVSGGGGTNNAVSFARKGLKTAIICELGMDLVASAIKEELKREKVKLEFVVEEMDEETGISSIMVSSDGGRSVAVYRGASGMLTKEDIQWDKFNTKWLYISSLGGEMELLEGLIGHAKNQGIKVVVNPGKKEIEQIGEWGGMSLFQGVEVLVLNREEATKISGINYANRDVWKGDHSLKGPRISVLTDGRNGGKVCMGNERFFYEALKAETVEETGAGDAFGSGFVAALILGKDEKTAIEWGKKQASKVVNHMGAKRGLMTLKEIGG